MRLEPGNARPRYLAATAAAATLPVWAVTMSWPATVLNVLAAGVPAGVAGFCLAVADVGRGAGR